MFFITLIISLHIGTINIYEYKKLWFYYKTNECQFKKFLYLDDKKQVKFLVSLSKFFNL